MHLTSQKSEIRSQTGDGNRPGSVWFWRISAADMHITRTSHSLEHGGVIGARAHAAANISYGERVAA